MTDMNSAYRAMALLLCAAAANAQVSTNASLFGKYFFRQVALETGSGATVSQTLSAEGNLNFDGNGNFTVTGQQIAGTTPGTALAVSNGIYTVNPGGFVTLSNPLLSGVTINARLGAEGLVGSSTEAGPTVFDLFIAVRGSTNPVTNRSMTGPYWVSSLEFPNGGVTDIRQTNFTLTADGEGGFAESTVTGQANNLGNTQMTQTVGPMTYMLNPDGSGTISFPAASGLTITTQLIAGTDTIYLAPDQNFFIGGSTAAGGHGIIVGIKAWGGGPSTSANNANWGGFFFTAGMSYDVFSSTLSTVVASVNPTVQAGGAGEAVWEQHAHQSGGNLDNTPLTPFSLGADGSGTAGPILGRVGQQHIDLASNTVVFATSGTGSVSSPAYQLFAGTSVLAQSETSPGPFLHPLGIFNAASYVPPGFPVSPGGFVALFGTGLATASAQASIPFPTILSQTMLSVNGNPARIYAISPTQINAVVPYGVTGTTATFVATVNGTPSNAVTVPLAPTAPGVFSMSANGLGDGAITHADNSLVSQASPAKPGEIVQVYLTGLGATNPNVPDGAAAPANPAAMTTAPVSVFVGGIPVTNIQFDGLSPGLASLYQLNIQIPSTVLAGPQMLEVQTAAGSTDLVDVWVQ